jgi:hypothetical protein
MADIGPVTDFAIGLDDADGWGAYSCDPTRKCTPTKLDAASETSQALAGALPQGVRRSKDRVVPQPRPGLL